MAVMSEARHQPVTGVVPPQVEEALIRDAWPSVTLFAAPAALGKSLILSIFLAPLGWFLLLPLYFSKVMPFLARRYRLTNRRLMICRGLQAVPSQEVELSRIDDVRLQENSYDRFYRAGTLEIISGGQVVMSLPACSFPDAFRIAILDACAAWAPKR
jgi:uncharacterized membrane protein YdbT with pleckstrin-like domain